MLQNHVLNVRWVLFQAAPSLFFIYLLCSFVLYKELHYTSVCFKITYYTYVGLSFSGCSSFIYLARFSPTLRQANNCVNAHPLQNHVLLVRRVLFWMGVSLFFIYLARFSFSLLQLRLTLDAIDARRNNRYSVTAFLTVET